MSDDLRTLGVGEGSANEALKLRANQLRGTIATEIANDASHLSEDAAQLLKFHGSYQQEDRDQRRARKEAGIEKAHQFMVRTRIPGGALTASQYLAIDDLAARFGNGTLRLTTRQGIQLHGVIKSDLRATIRAINDTLLSTLAACGDVNRNVMACPAPARNAAHAHVHAAARALAERLAPRTGAYHEIWLDDEKLDDDAPAAEEREPLYGKTYLPRKFKSAVAYPGDNCVDAYTQDLAFVAEVESDELLGYTVLAGGGMGSTHGKSETYPRLATPLAFVKPTELLEVAETIVAVYRDFGDRKNRKHARLKYAIEERGIAWFRAEVESRLGRALQDPHPVRFSEASDHLGWEPQADGKWCLGIYVENGRVADTVTSLARSGIRAVLERFTLDVRITGQQNVLLAGVDERDCLAVETILRDRGVETDPHALGLRRDAMACPALPTCGLAVAEAERALPAIVREIERELADLGIEDGTLGIRMTGCPNGCARPRMGDVGIVGRSLDVYDIFVGGDRAGTRLNELLAQGVRREAIAATLRPALACWKEERIARESFGDYAQRAGVEHLRAAAKRELIAS